MRAIVSRVSNATVSTSEGYSQSIESGFLVFLGVAHDDTEWDARFLADRVCHMRVFQDESGKMNLPPQPGKNEIMVISNFTIYGDALVNRRPSFSRAAPSALAEVLYERFMEACREAGFTVRSGQFGAHMHIDSLADGPVYLILESEDARKPIRAHGNP